MNNEFMIDKFISDSLSEIESVSSSISEIFLSADAGISFSNDNVSNNFDTIVSAIETFSVNLIELCENHVKDNPLSDYNEYFIRCRDFHIEMLKNLNVFKHNYKEQVSLYQ